MFVFCDWEETCVRERAKENEEKALNVRPSIVYQKSSLFSSHVDKEHLELLEGLGGDAGRDRRPRLGRRWGDRRHGWLAFEGEEEESERKKDEVIFLIFFIHFSSSSFSREIRFFSALKLTSPVPANS